MRSRSRPISRDLRDLGVLKAGGRYVLPPDEITRANGDFATLAQFVRGLRTAGPSPHRGAHHHRRGAEASPWPSTRREWPEVVGTISGDDTIFIATAQRAAQQASSSRACATSSGSESHVRYASARAAQPIVLAYSGGLDTSFLVPWVAQSSTAAPSSP